MTPLAGMKTARRRTTAAQPELLVFPGQPGWDDARRAWNLAVDQRPAAIALPESVDDVVAAVDHARTLGLQVAVQGTGHGAGSTSLEGTLLINTARMFGVEVEPAARVARVAAGTVWTDVVEAAVEHGLTALHGSAGDVGVVGYSLGGGIGWLARKHGLASSTIVSAEVVTADGEIVRADRESNADLLWALQGGGGSFGVVTELEVALFPVTEAFAGWLIWPLERASEVLAGWAEWTSSVPEEITSVGRLLQLPPLPELPEPLRGRQLAVVEAAYLGDERSGRELLAPLLELAPEIDSFATVPARALTELHQDPPAPVPARGEGWMLDAFDRRIADVLVDAAAMDGSSPLLSVEIRQLGGALGRPDPNGGVLSHLEAPYAMYSLGPAPGPEAVEAVDERIARVRTATEPWLARQRYHNFAERDVDPVSFYVEGDYRRLAEIRERVDPDGVFRAKHTIV
ncbi:MAG TPA: FAD-binding protein [Gaiella sp.]|nr:FAD-binding protein [Gaiella sp.]